MSNSDYTIRIEGLGKRYRIGQDKAATGEFYRYKSLRESLVNLARRPWSIRSNPVSKGETEEHNSFWALKDVCFDVKRGEVIGIIGRNGAGKSTLLKVLSRITKPTEGLIDLRGRVGSLLEVGTGFHPELSGRENIFLNGAILGMSQAEVRHKFDDIVEFSEVRRFLDTPVKQYSSGMYTRLAFAVAAHLESEILVVDEVLAVGDAEFQNKCLGKIGEVASSGRTVLFVSHNLAAVQTLCSTAIYLKSGRVASIGRTADVVAEYLGDSSTSRDGNVENIALSANLRLQQLRFKPSTIHSGNEVSIEVSLQSEIDTSVEGLCILIYSILDVRIAILDLRAPNGPYKLVRGVPATVHALTGQIPLVEGKYKIGLFIQTPHLSRNVLELTTIEVVPAPTSAVKVVPYPPEHRGFVSLATTELHFGHEDDSMSSLKTSLRQND